MSVDGSSLGTGGSLTMMTCPECGGEYRDGFKECAAYPDEKTSLALSWRNFLFPVINPKAGWLYAFLYTMSAWLASSRLEAADVIDLPTALEAAINAGIRDPLNGMWLFTIIAGFIFFTDTHVRSWRFVGGAISGVYM